MEHTFTHTIKCKGEREAEDKANRITDKDPTACVRVYVSGKLQGFVSGAPTSDKQPLGIRR